MSNTPGSSEKGNNVIVGDGEVAVGNIADGTVDDQAVKIGNIVAGNGGVAVGHMEGSTVTINNGGGLSPVGTTSGKQAKTSANKEAPTEGGLVINNSFTDDGEKGDQTTTVTTPNGTKLTVGKGGIAAEKIEGPITITNEF